MTVRSTAVGLSYVCLAAVGLVMNPSNVGAQATVRAPGPVSWLAAGDSYSSGEGIQGSVGDCSQSSRAYGPRAAQLLRSERGWSITDVAFTACTGAITTDFFNHANKTHPSQTMWASDLHPGGRFDVVTLSFGGNDIDFSGVIKECIGVRNSLSGYVTEGLGGGCKVDDQELDSRIARLVAGHGSSQPTGPFGKGGQTVPMSDFYTEVAENHLNTGGVLVVAGYPRLYAPSDQWPAWRHDYCGAVSAAEADMLGRAAVRLNSALQGAVSYASNALKSDHRIIYVSRLDEFDADGVSHSLCGPRTSWINGLGALFYAGRLESPFHPNEIGHQVTAEEVAGRVESALAGDEADDTSEPASSPQAPISPTSTPTVSDGSSRYDIGDEFDEPCYVAWPTAPTYTPTSIELTMACPNVPGQYLFVQVTYPDPDLPITPSTGTTRVHGEIINEATSAYGYKTLIVSADDIDLDP